MENDINNSKQELTSSIILKGAFGLLLIIMFIVAGIGLAKSNWVARSKGLEKPCYDCGKEEGEQKAGPYIGHGFDSTYIWLCDKCNKPSSISNTSKNLDYREVDGAIAKDRGSLFLIYLGLFAAICSSVALVCLLYSWFKQLKKVYETQPLG